MGAAWSRQPGRCRSLLLAYLCTCSAGVLQHFRGMAPRGLGDLEAAQHARDLGHALLGIERLDRGEGAACPRLLGHAQLLARVDRDLREVRDAENLVMARSEEHTSELQSPQ